MPLRRGPDRSAAAGQSLSQALGFSPSVVELGMGHPGLRRVFERMGGGMSFIISLDDDRIDALEVEVGLMHRGFEKEAERHSWSENLAYCHRLGLGPSLGHATAYCLAVEALAKIEVPKRALWWRVIGCELSRLYDHFVCLASMSSAGALSAAESLADRGAAHLAEFIGKTLWTGEWTDEKSGPFWIQIGGVRSGGAASDFVAAWASAREDLSRCLSAFEKVGPGNPSLSRRLLGVGPLSAETAHAWGITGPALRAAGFAADLRRDVPDLAYSELDFDVPVGEEGDAFDRMLVRLSEMESSLGIIDQCASRLVSLGPGDLAGVDPEAAIRPPEGAASSRIEAANGELGFSVVSNDEGAPLRVHCRAPSFFAAQLLPDMLVGSPLDDLFPAVASMHLIAAECDR